MSKLIGVFEAFNAIDSLESLIKICDVAIADAERLSKKETNTQNKNELHGIKEALEHDKNLLIESCKRLKKEYDELLKNAKNDEAFMSELESTTNVPEEYEKALKALKEELLSLKGYEKPEE